MRVPYYHLIAHMKSYMKYVKAHQSLVELTAILVQLPSRRTDFFNFLTRLTGLPPNTVKMVLCSTSSGTTLSSPLMEKVSKTIGIPLEILFPANRAAKGSLVSIYAQQSSQPLEYSELIEDIRLITKASRRAVVSWIYGRHSPRSYSQRAIADLLCQPVASPFPKRIDPSK